MKSLDLFLRDDVDDARDGVCAVSRGRAVTQNFDTVDDGVRNGIQVDEVAMAIVSEGIRREAQTVGDRQRRLDRQTAQCRRIGAAGEVEARIPTLLDGAGVVGRKALQCFGNSIDTALFQRFRADDGDRRRGFRVGASQDRTGNDDFFERLFLREDLRGRQCAGSGSGYEQRVPNRRADLSITSVDKTLHCFRPQILFPVRTAHRVTRGIAPNDGFPRTSTE